MTELAPEIKSLIGAELPGAVLTVERGPISVFAEAVKDSNSVYQSLDAARRAGFDNLPVPPTFPFALVNWGRFREEQPEGWDSLGPMAEVFGKLMSGGGLILHGEQEFLYYGPVVAGDVLTVTGTLKDIYTKVSGEKTMTFVVSEQEYRNQRGEHVLTQITTILHRA
jgi:acyl dehydratase